MTHQHPPLGLACGVPAGLGLTSALDLLQPCHLPAALSPPGGLVTSRWPCHCHWVTLLQARAACTCAFRRQVSGSGRCPSPQVKSPESQVWALCQPAPTSPHLELAAAVSTAQAGPGMSWMVRNAFPLHCHPPAHIWRGYPGCPGGREGLAWGRGSRGHALGPPGASPGPGLPPAALTPAERAPSGLRSRP